MDHLSSATFILYFLITLILWLLSSMLRTELNTRLSARLRCRCWWWCSSNSHTHKWNVTSVAEIFFLELPLQILTFSLIVKTLLLCAVLFKNLVPDRSWTLIDNGLILGVIKGVIWKEYLLFDCWSGWIWVFIYECMWVDSVWMINLPKLAKRTLTVLISLWIKLRIFLYLLVQIK